MKYIILIISLLISTQTFSQEDLYNRVEEMPRFPGCENVEGTVGEKTKCSNDKLIEYMYNHVQYPKAAQLAGVEGVVVIQFVIDKMGVIQDAQIVREIGESCGSEALRVVNEMADAGIKWRPGIENGNPVDVQFTLPVNFKLEGEAKKDANSSGDE